LLATCNPLFYWDVSLHKIDTNTMINMKNNDTTKQNFES